MAQRWKASDVVITMVLVNFLFVAYYLLSKYSSLKVKPSILHISLFGMLIILFKLKFKQSIRILGFKKDNLLKIIGLSLGVAFFNCLIFYILYLLFGKPETFSLYTVKELKYLNSISDYARYLGMSIILVPLIEESINKGILYSPYRKKYGPIKAIIIISLFFSSGHLGGGLLPSFIAGIFNGVLYEKTESIIAPIVAHGAYNLFNFLIAVC